MRRSCIRALAVVAFAGLLASPAAAEQKYRGLTAGQWSAIWWQEIFAVPVEGGIHHPLFDGGAFGGNNRTVFAGGPVMPAGSPKTTLHFTVAAGTHLLLPIITVECSVAEGPPFHGENEAELRACANGLLDGVSDPYAAIDGRPVDDPASTRVESPLFRYGPLPAANALGLAPGTQSDAVSAGFFLLVPPPSVGEHRIIIRADVLEPGFAVDAEFVITVVPPRGK